MTSPGGGRRVLLVDDAAEVRLLLQLVLEGDGFVVTVAQDGPEGLAAARVQQPDVVLLDVQLPGMDGPDVLRALRADAATAALPVVLLTAEPAGVTEPLHALGITGVLRKPFAPGAVAQELADLLEP